MYTQCPKCETVFHITLAQLKAHDGVVRCGRCDNVFNADQQLFSNIPEKDNEKPAPRKRARAETASKPKTVKPKTTSVAKKHPASNRKTAVDAPLVEDALESTPAPPMPAQEKSNVAPGTDMDEVVFDVLPQRASSRRFSGFWLAGSVLLATALAAQSAYFYRDQLAAYPALTPYLNDMCALLDCRVQPPYDVNRIELVQPTSIAPHPRIANALRLRATLVNRAESVQAHPFMQVTLTDSAGRVLARRVFQPHQYLEQRATPGTDMPPHLAVSALIDITNPDGKAVGYQIDFLAPSADGPTS